MIVYRRVFLCVGRASSNRRITFLLAVAAILSAGPVRGQPRCSLATLKSPQRCEGAWYYGLYPEACYQKGRGPACGLCGHSTVCQPQYNSCARPEHGRIGLTSKKTSSSFSRSGVGDCHRVPGGRLVCDCSCLDDPSDSRSCHEVARKALDESRLGLPAEDASLIQVGSSVLGPFPSGGSSGASSCQCNVRCEVTLSKIPVYELRENAACGRRSNVHCPSDDIPGAIAGCPPQHQQCGATGTPHECSYRVEADPIYWECRAPAFGRADPHQCEPEAVRRRYSRLGVDLATLGTTDSLANLAAAPAPICTSCDDVTFSSDADAIAKFQSCLLGQYRSFSATSVPSGVDVQAELAVLARRIKLLFELGYSGLSPEFRAVARQLYSTNVDQEVSCGEPVPFPDSLRAAAKSATCPSTAPVFAGLTFCRRLALPHVDPALRQDSLGECLALGKEVVRLPEACARKDFVNIAQTLSTGMIEKEIARLRPAVAGSLDEAPLDATLGLIRDWYANLSATFEVSPREDELVGALVNRLWATLTPRAEATLTPAQFLSASMAIDSTILRLSLGRSGQMPKLIGRPLLVVVNEAFRATQGRAESLSVAHDIGCRVVGCVGAGVTSELSDLHRALGALDSQDELRAALAQSANFGPESRALFGRLLEIYPAFAEALRGAGWKGQPVGAPGLMLQPNSLGEFSRMVAASAARWNAYGKTGMFSSGEAGILLNGLHRGFDVRGEYTQRLQRLKEARTDDENKQKELLQQQLAVLGLEQESTALAASLQLKDAQFQQLADDLAGLRQSAMLSQARFAEFAADLASTTATSDAQGAYVDVRSNVLSIAGKHARYRAGQQKVAAAAVLDNDSAVYSVPAQKGDVISIVTEGRWSPVCALGAQDLPRGKIGVGDVATGPEGFLLSLQQGEYVAKANTSATALQADLRESGSVKACAGIKAETGAIFFGTGVSGYASLDACMSTDMGTTYTQRTDSSDSQGSELRKSSTLIAGLRLPGTPFPDLPAGALGIVRLPRGKDGFADVMALDVVQAPSTAVVATDDQDIYLIVNDKAGCNPKGGALTVRVRVQRPASSAARQVADASNEIFRALEEKTNRFVAQGRILPGDLNTMRDDAFHKLELKLNGATAPPSLNTFFFRWLNLVLNRLEQEVEAASIAKQMALLSGEVAGLRQEQQIQIERRRFQHNLFRETLVNFDFQSTNERLRDLAIFIDRQLVPFADMRHPHLFVHLRANSVDLAPFRRLADVSLRADAASVVKDAVSGGDMLLSKLSDELNSDPSPSVTIVSLSFPRRDNKLPKGSWAAVDSMRANAFWKAIDGDKDVVLDVLPEDLYGRLTGQASRLSCFDANPIVRTAMAFISRPNDGSNGRWSREVRKVDAVADNSIVTVGAQGPRRWTFVNRDWLSMALPLTFGSPSEATSHLTPEIQQMASANGLSPFFRLTFNLQGLRQEQLLKPDEVSELVLVLQVESFPMASPGVPGVTSCR